MGVFYGTLVSTYILGVASRFTKKQNQKPIFIFFILIMMIFITVSAFRDDIGDTGMYKHTYGLIAKGTVGEDGYEKGFIFFLTMLTNISVDPQFMLIVTSVITQGINIWFLRKYSSYFELELFMYIASGYFLTTMNGIRQAMAASIMLLGTRFLIERKFTPYLILTLIMSTIHNSALVMIPVYFIVNSESWSKNFVKTIGIMLIVTLFGGAIMNLMFQLLDGTKFGEYSQFDEGGSNIIRTVIAMVPVVMAYLQRKRLREIFPQCDIFVNLAIVNMLIMALSLYNWIFARMTYYFIPYTLVLLPYIIKSIDIKEQRRLIYYAFLLGYSGFMYAEYVLSIGANYTSVILGI
ncbi:EpsG family protein [Terrisporobacter vanillatitrophus]|uniref:EpsG family protein n=1 Tax=Terrisporobacter vanillatitrophus TaxID=3058402 RepID=UPI003368F8A7